jgi:hypothetical protein
MRSNQAAVQRRVNGARANGVPPVPSQQKGYAPYPPSSGYTGPVPSQQPQQQQQPPQQQQQGYSNSIPTSQTQTNAMPPKLNAQQQLQFILNALGDRIAKLEVGHQTITQTLGVSIPLNTTVSAPQNAKNYDQEIGQIQQNMNHLNLSIERLSKNLEQINEQQQQILRQPQQPQQPQQQPSQTQTNQIPNDEIVQTQEQILNNVDALSSELDTRTEILTTEINKTKDLVLQLQSTVIHVFQTHFTKSNTPYDQDLENENSNAPEEDENQELPTLEYINLDSNASFEYNLDVIDHTPTITEDHDEEEEDYQDQYEKEDEEI